jgi:hypothetical protein
VNGRFVECEKGAETTYQGDTVVNVLGCEKRPKQSFAPAGGCVDNPLFTISMLEICSVALLGIFLFGWQTTSTRVI